MRRRTFLCGAIGAGWLAGQESAPPLGTLAYVANDALWIRDLPDGRPQRVASGARIASPRISPSAQWIAYRQHDRVWVVSRDAIAPAAPRLLGEGAIQWRPNGDELLLEQPPGLSVFSPGNGWVGPVRSIPDAALPVAFSPDGGEMVYSRRVESGTAPGSGATGLLCRVDAGAALPAKTILSHWSEGLIPYRWIGDAVWYWGDPDFSGSFEADGLDLFHVPAAGGEPRRLGVKSLVHDDFLALSPAGERLAVTAGGGRESWHDKRIALVDRASGAVRYLTDENTAAICPAWSPNGSRIAFVALLEGADNPEVDRSGPKRLFLGQRRISVADAAGNSQPVRMTGDDRFRDEEPIWLADERHILFCRMERGCGDSGSKSVWLMDDHGGAVTRIAGSLQATDEFAGEWFGYYGTFDWRAVIDYHRGGK